MDGFPSLDPSRRRSSCRTALLFGAALSILCVGTGCGDFTLFGDDDQGICDPDPCEDIQNAETDTCDGVGVDDFTCECDAGYVWDGATESCEDDPCDPDPCDEARNEVAGSCTDLGADDYTCDCDSGYTWNGQINQCTSGAVGTCDDLEDCLLTCNGFEDFLCQNSCYAAWTGCECDLDFNGLVTSCGFICFGDCPLTNPFTKSCWDCVIPCGFDSQCQ
jgi:hypothetical protein